jgi:hypothetical protein
MLIDLGLNTHQRNLRESPLHRLSLTDVSHSFASNASKPVNPKWEAGMLNSGCQDVREGRSRRASAKQ